MDGGTHSEGPPPPTAVLHALQKSEERVNGLHLYILEVWQEHTTDSAGRSCERVCLRLLEPVEPNSMSNRGYRVTMRATYPLIYPDSNWRRYEAVYFQNLKCARVLQVELDVTKPDQHRSATLRALSLQPGRARQLFKLVPLSANFSIGKGRQRPFYSDARKTHTEHAGEVLEKLDKNSGSWVPEAINGPMGMVMQYEVVDSTDSVDFHAFVITIDFEIPYQSGSVKVSHKSPVVKFVTTKDGQVLERAHIEIASATLQAYLERKAVRSKLEIPFTAEYRRPGQRRGGSNPDEPINAPDHPSIYIVGTQPGHIPAKGGELTLMFSDVLPSNHVHVYQRGVEVGNSGCDCVRKLKPKSNAAQLRVEENRLQFVLPAEPSGRFTNLEAFVQDGDGSRWYRIRHGAGRSLFVLAIEPSNPAPALAVPAVPPVDGAAEPDRASTSLAGHAVGGAESAGTAPCAPTESSTDDSGSPGPQLTKPAVDPACVARQADEAVRQAGQLLNIQIGNDRPVSGADLPGVAHFVALSFAAHANGEPLTDIFEDFNMEQYCGILSDPTFADEDRSPAQFVTPNDHGAAKRLRDSTDSPPARPAKVSVASLE
eukprot:TRINITY_DN3696_c0_g1_i2.p1 TRINITY_DN3696_c0_g1~~TRINITY_DN3696_c0_g1_i2.p1  ORF type:complete len:630 (-),score=21.13 TRINITY_DN3696_c0_g1_i2:459-2252(-)